MPYKPNHELLNVLMVEYGKLKDEQIQRIGFRDNLLYVTLVTVGSIISLSVSNTNNAAALLLIPWVCLILGWTYLVNDEKISAVARYIRLILDERIRKELGSSESAIFKWEIQHRNDARRRQRKVLQLFVDETTFCISSLAAACLYLMFDVTPRHPLVILIILVEVISILILGIQITVYANMEREQSVLNSSN